MYFPEDRDEMQGRTDLEDEESLNNVNRLRKRRR